MKSGFEKVLALALAAATAAPALAILPDTSAPSVRVVHPTVEAGLPIPAAGLEALSAKNGIVDLDESRSRIVSIQGDLTAPSTGSAERIALGYAAQQYPDAAFQMTGIRDSGVARHVHLGQTVHGKPVFGMDFAVHVAADGRVTMIGGTVVDALEAVNESRLAPADVAPIVARELGEGELGSVEAVYYPAVEGLRHAYRTELAREGSHLVVLVDAESGKVLFAADTVHRLEGTGSVYRQSPLQGEPSVETLADLKDGGQLAGSWADVRNEDEDRAQSDDRKFVYESGNTHFDEVNVYYHLNLIHSYYKTLGLTTMDSPIVATVHVGDNYDNAYFSPRSGELAFGDGSRLNDLAKDETVVYHEYTHAVTHSIVGQMWMGESGGLHEGYSDYFAGTLADSPVVGAYAGQRLPSGNIRNMDNELHYPEDSGSEPHKAGRVWGGACWDIREALGPNKADRLVHQSRFYLSRFGPTFNSAYKAILKADQELYAGANASALAQIFTKRGIAKEGETLSLRDMNRKELFRALEQLR